MNLLIENTELKLLLEQRKRYIGNRTAGLYDSIFAAITFLFALLFTECNDIGAFNGKYIKIVFLILDLGFLFRGVYLMIQAGRDDYSTEKLYNEITELNRMEHPFSILLLKDSFEKYANRYLLYYDLRWKCFLFPNVKTKEMENEKNCIERLSNQLKVDDFLFSIVKEEEKIHQKYSVSDKKMKWYHHTFYKITLQEFNDQMKKSEFTIDGVVYRWMSIAEMEADSRISEVNSDIVSFVKQL